MIWWIFAKSYRAGDLYWEARLPAPR
jgi:hypothetical protein